MLTIMSKMANLVMYPREGKAPDTPGGSPEVSPTPCVPEAGEVTCAPGIGPNMTHPSAQGVSDWAMQVEMVGYVYIMPAICTLDITLNLLTVLVFCRSIFRSPIYTYLKALAVADIITGVITMPIGMSRCGACDVSTLEYSRIFYEVFIFVPLTNMSETTSAWMVIVLAVERLISVRLPMLDKTSSKAKHRALFVVAMVALSAIALNMPYFFVLYIGDSNKTYKTAFGQSNGFDAFSWIRASLVQFAPLIILIILNVFLVLGLQRSQERYRRMSMASKASIREKAQIRLNMMLIGTVLLFIIGNIPVAFSYTIVFTKIFGEDSLYGDVYAVLRVITHLVAVLSYALDFVIYCVVNQHFRNACNDVVSCDRNKRRISDVSPSSKKDSLSPSKF